MRVSATGSLLLPRTETSVEENESAPLCRSTLSPNKSGPRAVMFSFDWISLSYSSQGRFESDWENAGVQAPASKRPNAQRIKVITLSPSLSARCEPKSLVPYPRVQHARHLAPLYVLSGGRCQEESDKRQSTGSSPVSTPHFAPGR